MSLARHDPLGRFTDVAELYARYRPGYPAPAVDFVVAHCGLSKDSILVDVGCGTGISSRAFAERGIKVIGIEPNAEMRLRAEAEAFPPGVASPTYRAGRAEATGLPGGVADTTLAAQAFHWFEPMAAMKEFHRILKPRGWGVIMYNERDETDPFTAAYGVVVRAVRDSTAIEASRVKAGEVLFNSPLFRDAVEVVVPNEQVLDETGLMGRAFSASYAPREPHRAAKYEGEIRRVYAEFQRGHRVVLHYKTTLYLAQRQPDA